MRKLIFGCVMLMLGVGTLQAQVQQLGQATIAASKGTHVLDNEFLKIIVNAGPEDQGRFAVETMGGDPDNANDDYQPLVFGRPIPWTSYTTVWVDGEAYVFGGLNHKLKKRNGTPVKYGEFVSQTTTDEGIVTEYKFGKIRVAQKLNFLRNISTKVKDSALISYDVANLDTASHRVGLRLMMDTKLGENDGAPFRIGAKAIVDEVEFKGAEIQDYWQTFDSLASPNVIAQGTLRGGGLTAPDRLMLSNWGTLADNPWEVTVVPGRSFVRQGELEKDTALALYWEPRALAPNQVAHYRTAYGLGGVTLAKGALSLGLTAPAEVYGNTQSPFMVVAYVSNTGGYDARDVDVSVDVGQAFGVVKGQAKAHFPLIPRGQTRQVMVYLMPMPGYFGVQKLQVDVSSTTLEPNRISRKIDLVAAPSLQASIQVPDMKVVTLNYYFDAVMTVTNTMSLPIDGVVAKIESSEFIQVPDFETLQKSVGRVWPHQPVKVNWKLRLKKMDKDLEIPVVGSVQSEVTPLQKVQGKIVLQEPQSDFKLRISTQNVAIGDYFYVDVAMRYVSLFSNWSGLIQFDPSQLVYVRWSPELWLENDNPGLSLMVEQDSLLLRGVRNLTPAVNRRMAKFHFRALKPGPVEVRFIDQKGIIQSVRLNVASSNRVLSGN